MITKIGIIFFLTLYFTFAKIQVFPDERYIDCSDKGVAKYVDYANLEFEYVNDTDYFLNGKFQILIKIYSNFKIIQKVT